MTCVVGLVDRGAVHLGGDAIAIGGYDMHVRETPKVFRVGALVVGCCGSFRLADVIRYHFAPPPPPAKGDLHRYVAVSVVEALRDACKTRGAAVIENNMEEIGGSVLVGVRGALFVIDDDFHVGEPTGGRAAIGLGAPLALGALYALGKAGSPRKRLRTALAAAEAYNAGVRSPFHFITLRPSRSP